jgi:uncharacterized protein
MADLLKILSIDGGGIRGVIPATILEEIESRTQSRVAELFDLIAGTSTGGILALGLAKPGDDGRPELAASELVELYKREGKRIFARSPWHRVVAIDNLLNERYDTKGIAEVLQHYFGDTMLSAAVTETLITTYELETREPWFFARHKAVKNPATEDFPMRFVARATSAAPTYFEPEEVTFKAPDGRSLDGGLIDGGVFANNPTMCAYVETMELHPKADVLVVSLGTGQHTRAIHYAEATDWGIAHWAKPILDVVFDGVSDTVDHQMKVLCRAGRDGPERYYRFQTELDRGSDDMDDVTQANLAALEQKARDVIEKENNNLDELCKELTKTASPV